MTTQAPRNSPSSAWINIIVNVLAPVLILDYCSSGDINPLNREAGQHFWHIGPLWAMVVALLLPITYGIRSLIVNRKFELMSAVGLTGVLLTGIISLFVIGRNGQIHVATPWLFAAKEALIPLFLASAVIVSSRTATPLLKMFIYNPDVFDISRIEKAIGEYDQWTAYNRLLKQSTWVLAGTLVCSSIGNFILSYQFMNPVLDLPVMEQQLHYNLAISKITWWGFLIIGVPLLLALICILVNLVKKLGIMTKLSRNEILMAG